MKSPFELILDAAKGIASSGKSAITRVLNTDVGQITGNQQINSTKTGIAANTVIGLPKATLTTAKDMFQSITRTGVGVGGDVANVFKAPSERTYEFQPKGKIQTAVFGNEPVKTLAMRVADGERAISDSPFAQKYNLDKAALPIAFGGTIGSSFLDLFPGTAGKGKFIKQIAEETSELGIRTLLKNNAKNLTDDAINKLTPILAQSKDPKFIEKTLGSIVMPKDVPIPLSNRMGPRDSIVKPSLADEAIVAAERKVNGLPPLPKQSNVSVPSMRPATPEEAATRYFTEIIDPEIKQGKATIIGADNLKDHFGKDYNDANHPIYSKASFQLYEKALKENPDPVVRLTGGGPGSGKTELINQNIAKDFKGVIYDSNLSKTDFCG